ncbi:TcpQ domain-containing protein [Citrobacter freundii]|uniref:TcpQ domain-containing protein n=1 Tax=Citrobacter freundii TaxID=546 RepID=UPI001EF11FC0|nr:TcpQ domain-containing protein [Citrobacter freundii]
MNTKIKMALSFFCFLTYAGSVEAGINIKNHDDIKSVDLGSMHGSAGGLSSISSLKTASEIAATKSKSIVAPASNYWIANRGESLQDLTVRWAELAGYQVVWDIPYDYHIDASFVLNGGFIDVIKKLYNEFGNSERPMKIDIYKQQKLIHVGSL